MAYATSEDVASRLGRELTVEETGLAEVRLEDAERLILRRITDLDAKVAAGDIDTDDLVQVEAEAVLRLVRNPQGLLSEQDGSYGYQFSSQVSSGRLEILPEEWGMLGVTRSRVSMLSPSVDRAVTVSWFGNGG